MSFIKSSSRPLFLMIAGLFFCLGLFLRFQTTANRPYNTDETCHVTHFLTNPAFVPFWERQHYGAELTCFPGFYLTTIPFIKLFTTSPWGCAIPSILATLAGYFFFLRLTLRQLSSPLAFAIAWTVYTFNATLIYHAFELRPYAFLAFLGPMLLDLTEGLFLNPTRRRQIYTGLVFFAATIYHAYGLIIVALASLFCLIYYRKKEPSLTGRLFLSFFLPWGVGCGLIWLWYASGSPPGTAMDRGVFQFIPSPYTNPLGFFKNVIGNLLGHKFFYPLLLGLAALFIPHPLTRKLWGLLILVICLPIMLILASNVASDYWFLQRQFIFTMPVFALTLGLGMQILLESLSSLKKNNPSPRP